MSSIVALSFRRNILSSQLVTCKVLLSQPQKFVIRNSNSVLFQSLLSRSYTNSTFPLSSLQKVSSSFSYLNKFAEAIEKCLTTITVAGIISLILVDFLYAGDHSFYHVVYGEFGTGKSTLTRIAAREVGQCVIYVDVPEDPDEFRDELERALNFKFEERISYTAQLMRKIFSNNTNR
ncbi:P-loop containing nucleoside triphosphate hydrolase protein [Rhizophagus clarus]|uniref:P-loop containing nucleoside triphosphate hydrolase protein n=1 Tax=Rhizophagus clarus TaxID=94130 RepID=A0A8H3ME21_9GLOM|nr:P-loop containing nucleoside triphosphate hydrolase protein [Rhizophagus clarus]